MEGGEFRERRMESREGHEQFKLDEEEWEELDRCAREFREKWRQEKDASEGTNQKDSIESTSTSEMDLQEPETSQGIEIDFEGAHESVREAVQELLVEEEEQRAAQEQREAEREEWREEREHTADSDIYLESEKDFIEALEELGIDPEDVKKRWRELHITQIEEYLADESIEDRLELAREHEEKEKHTEGVENVVDDDHRLVRGTETNEARNGQVLLVEGTESCSQEELSEAPEQERVEDKPFLEQVHEMADEDSIRQEVADTQGSRNDVGAEMPSMREQQERPSKQEGSEKSKDVKEHPEAPCGVEGTGTDDDRGADSEEREETKRRQKREYILASCLPESREERIRRKVSEMLDDIEEEIPEEQKEARIREIIKGLKTEEDWDDILYRHDAMELKDDDSVSKFITIMIHISEMKTNGDESLEDEIRNLSNELNLDEDLIQRYLDLEEIPESLEDIAHREFRYTLLRMIQELESEGFPQSLEEIREFYNDLVFSDELHILNAWLEILEIQRRGVLKVRLQQDWEIYSQRDIDELVLKYGISSGVIKAWLRRLSIPKRIHDMLLKRGIKDRANEQYENHSVNSVCSEKTAIRSAIRSMLESRLLGFTKSQREDDRQEELTDEKHSYIKKVLTDDALLDSFLIENTSELNELIQFHSDIRNLNQFEELYAEAVEFLNRKVENGANTERTPQLLLELIQCEVNRRIFGTASKDFEIRSTLVNGKRYIRIRDRSVTNWMNYFGKENFHLASLKQKVKLREDVKRYFGVRSNDHLSQVISDLTDVKGKEGRRTRRNADLVGNHPRLKGETLHLFMDVLDVEFDDIAVKYIGRGKNGVGVIRKPKLSVNPVTYFSLLVPSIVSDGHIEPTGHIRYCDGCRENIERVRDTTNLIGDVDTYEEIHPVTGATYLHIPAVIGRLLFHIGMKSGDKNLNNCGLPRIIHEASDEHKALYLRIVVSEDGSFSNDSGRGRFFIFRSVALHPGNKSSSYRLAPILSMKYRKLIERIGSQGKINFGGKADSSDVFQIRWHTLVTISEDDTNPDSIHAAELCSIIKDTPPRLLIEEIKLASDLGIQMEIYPVAIRLFKKSGRVTVSWQAQTNSKDDSLIWALIARPIDRSKSSKVDLWLQEGALFRTQRNL